MPINSITNNTGDELTLFGPSGATIDTIPNGKQSGQEPITIESAPGTLRLRLESFRTTAPTQRLCRAPETPLGRRFDSMGAGKTW
jgi:hypothetical protein